VNDMMSTMNDIFKLQDMYDTQQNVDQKSNQ